MFMWIFMDNHVVHNNILCYVIILSIYILYNFWSFQLWSHCKEFLAIRAFTNIGLWSSLCNRMHESGIYSVAFSLCKFLGNAWTMMYSANWKVLHLCLMVLAFHLHFQKKIWQCTVSVVYVEGQYSPTFYE